MMQIQIKNSETTLAIYVTEYQPLWYRNRSSNTQQWQRRVVKQRNEINCLEHIKGCSTSIKLWYTCILPNVKSPKSCQIYAFWHCLQMQNYVIHGKLIWVKKYLKEIFGSWDGKSVRYRGEDLSLSPRRLQGNPAWWGRHPVNSWAGGTHMFAVLDMWTSISTCAHTQSIDSYLLVECSNSKSESPWIAF